MSSEDTNSRVYILPLSFYKSKVAAQFKLCKPSPKEDGGWRQGSVNLEMAPRENSKAPSDWKKIARFAMTAHDIGKVFAGLKGPERSVEIYHDANAGKQTKERLGKTLKLAPGENNDGSFKLSLFQTQPDGEKRSYIIYLDPSEMWTLTTLLQGAVSSGVLFNWDRAE